MVEMIAMEPVVYVVDEDPVSGDTIRRLASVMNLPCRVFTSGCEFLEALDRSQCGCLVTELKVSDISGLRILERLIEEGSMLPVVFITAHASLPLAVRAMRAGAFHFLEKPCHEHELWDIIQDAVATDQERRRTTQQYSAIQERLASLTRKEEEVLWLIGEGKPNRVIAAELNLSIRTVEVRRNSLLKKLGIPNSDELVRFAMSLGNGFSSRHFPYHARSRCPLQKNVAFPLPARPARAAAYE